MPISNLPQHYTTKPPAHVTLVMLVMCLCRVYQGYEPCPFHQQRQIFLPALTKAIHAFHLTENQLFYSELYKAILPTPLTIEELDLLAQHLNARASKEGGRQRRTIFTMARADTPTLKETKAALTGEPVIWPR